MKIIFHIFVKDLRRHWPEVLISLALIGVYVWDQPRQWVGRSFKIRLAGNFFELLPLLLVLAWAFLIVRVIQNDSLVGDRQYWLTRPYEWPKLLFAKLLFIALCIHAPLFVGQIVLLNLANFPVTQSLLGVLLMHLVLFVTIVIPSLAIASINPGIGRTSITVIGLILFTLGIGGLLSYLPDASFSPDSYDNLQALLCLIAAVVIIVVQFSSRNVRASWFVLAAALAIVAVLVVLPALPRFGNQFVPAPTQTHPLPAKFSIDSSMSFSRAPGQSLEFYGNDVRVQFPLHVENLDEKSFLKIHAAKLDLDLPTGEQWTSHWQYSSDDLLPGRTRAWPALEVKRSIVEHYGDTTLNGRLSLWIEVYRLGDSSQITSKRAAFLLPGGARCAAFSSGFDPQCFSAVNAPGPFVLRADLPTQACPVYSDSKDETWASAPAYATFLNDSSIPDFDLTPIHTSSLSFFRLHAYENDGVRVPLCPGTTFSVTTTKLLYATRADIGLLNIRLTNYLPTYPLKIRPPLSPPPLHHPTDTLSLNFAPPAFRAAAASR